MQKKLLTTLAVAGILMASATASATGRPDADKNCPGSSTWDQWVVAGLLGAFGIVPGAWILDECAGDLGIPT